MTTDIRDLLTGATGLVRSHSISENFERTDMRSLDELRSLNDFVNAPDCESKTKIMNSVVGSYRLVRKKYY